MYGPFDFSRMNETDVRESIIVPLLGSLGYRHSSMHDIITEQSLRYPALALGRKKKTDPKLRGKADYILEVEKRLRWVIEVKSPEVPISQDDRDQAWSYAVHPEVKALFYLVTNGLVFELFKASDGPEVGSLLTIGHDELREKIAILANVLSPMALVRDFPAYVLDVGKPLAAGLRSFAKVTNGAIEYVSCVPPLAGFSMVGFTQHIKEGSVERTEDGRIAAYLRIGSGFRQNDDFLKEIGQDVFEVFADASELSADPERPTAFRSEIVFVMPRGSSPFDVVSGKRVELPFDFQVSTVNQALGWFDGSKLRGVLKVEMRMPFVPLVTIVGSFEITLA